MKRLLLLLVACGSSGTPPPVVANSAPTDPAPDLAALRHLLEPLASSKFGKLSADDRGCNVSPTIGEYVALLVRNGEHGEDAGDTHRLEGGCHDHYEHPTGIDPPESPDYWQCIIAASVSDASGESPWHYELRLRVRKADRAIDIPTLACPGA